MEQPAGDWTSSDAALARLCELYWYPIYAYLRRRGYHPDLSRELTSGFLASLLADTGSRKSKPARGRFRPFLLRSLKRYVVNYFEQSRRATREALSRSRYPILRARRTDFSANRSATAIRDGAARACARAPSRDPGAARPRSAPSCRDGARPRRSRRGRRAPRSGRGKAP